MICQFKTKNLTKNSSKLKGKNINKKCKNIGEIFLRKLNRSNLRKKRKRKRKPSKEEKKKAQLQRIQQ